jgi:hypothetical protein
MLSDEGQKTRCRQGRRNRICARYWCGRFGVCKSGRAADDAAQDPDRCPTPLSFTATEITAHSAVLNFTLAPDHVYTSIEIDSITTRWKFDQNESGTYSQLIDDLKPNWNYDLDLGVMCDGYTWSGGDSLTFRTLAEDGSEGGPGGGRHVAADGSSSGSATAAGPGDDEAANGAIGTAMAPANGTALGTVPGTDDSAATTSAAGVGGPGNTEPVSSNQVPLVSDSAKPEPGWCARRRVHHPGRHHLYRGRPICGRDRRSLQPGPPRVRWRQGRACSKSGP